MITWITCAATLAALNLGAAPGTITTSISATGSLGLGATFSATFAISGYTDAVEIDGFNFRVNYDPAELLVTQTVLNDSPGADENWLRKSPQDSVGGGGILADFTANVVGEVRISAADLRWSSTRGTLAAGGFLCRVNFEVIGSRSGIITPSASAGGTVLFDRDLSPAAVPSFIGTNIHPVTYSLTTGVSGSGSVSRNPDQPVYVPAATVTLTANPAPGWDFNNWSGDASGTANPLDVVMTTNTIITATFVPGFSLTLVANGSGTVARSPDQTLYSSNSTVMLTATPSPGWGFSGWSGNASGTTNPLSVTMTTNKSITANFSQHTLSVSANGGGTVIKYPDQPFYAFNSTVTLTAVPASGWRLNNWSGDASGTANPLSVVMTNNKSITANFQPALIVANANDRGVGSLRQAIADAPMSTVITFAPNLTGTITLTSGELLIDKTLTITGPGAMALAVNGNNSSRVFDITAGTVVLSGLAITNGRVLGTTGANGVNPGDAGATGGGGFGGGIYNNGDLTLLNCWIVGSIAKGGVGGVGGGDTFDVQAGNGGVGGMGAGGGIYNNGLLTLVNCTASGNSTLGGLGGSGANGLNYFYGDGGGGGTGGLGTGGGVCNNGIVNVTNCTLSGNASSGGTGGVGGNAHAQGDAGGGGAGGTGTGGGLASLNNLHLSSCTLSLNSLGAGAGGLGGSGSFGGGPGSPGTTQAGGLQSTTTANVIQNSLIAGNSAATLPDCKGSFTSLGFNLVGITNGGSGFTAASDQAGSLASPINPGLGPLQNNGGPTPTMALLSGSRAVDKGKSFGLTTDQRGAPRPVDLSLVTNASGGDGSDIGAFELQPSPLLSIARSANNVVVSWSTNDTGFTLEARTNLNSSVNWSNATPAPVIVGSRYAVTNTASGNKFYRLKAP